MLYYQIISKGNIVYSSDKQGTYFNNEQEIMHVADDVVKLYLQLRDNEYEIKILPREELISNEKIEDIEQYEP